MEQRSPDQRHSAEAEQQQSLSQPSSNPLPISTTPLESNSDFYNTPLTGHTPVYASANMTSDSKNGIATSSTPQASVTTIPGLSINDNVTSALSSEDGDNEHKSEVPTESHTNEDTPMTHETAAPAYNAIQAVQVSDSAQGVQTTDAMQTEETEHPEWEVDSSPYESSTDSSSDSSDSDDSDEDEEDYPILTAEETARILMQAEGGSDDEGDTKAGGGSNLKTANEQNEVAEPIPDITVTPDMKIVPLGHLQSLVDNLILIKATVSGDYQVLESNSLLCLEDRTLIGVVADTLGRVEEPLYTVRFQDPAKIQELGLAVGNQIFYVESHSEFVFTQPLKGMKGSDASNFHDEEVGEDEIEFSDDEAEAEYKRKQKQKKKEKRENSGMGGKSRKDAPGPSPLGRSDLNYDDDAGRATEDGYTPLARPKNYHEMMSHQEPHMETSSATTSRGNFRGRGRGRGGFDRGGGRGSGRGRGGDSRGRGNYHNERRSEYSNENPSAPQYQNFSSPAATFPAQQYTQYPPYPQQTQQQPQFPSFGQAPTAGMPQFPFQIPFQQNPYQNLPMGAHINPAFLAALQQQQQQQQQQHYQSLPVTAPTTQPQTSSNNQTAFSQVQAQLDILRQLSGGGSGSQPQ